MCEPLREGLQRIARNPPRTRRHCGWVWRGRGLGAKSPVRRGGHAQARPPPLSGNTLFPEMHARPFARPYLWGMETIVNRVAESGLINLNLEEFLPTDVVVFDLQPFLYMGLMLKEKDYRAALPAQDWEVYRDRDVLLTCSADAIIPVWAYMLAASFLQPVARRMAMGKVEEARLRLMLDRINSLDVQPYAGQRVVVKGCGDTPIPDEAYAAITFRLRPVVKSLMYGEPCSTVPIFKQKIG